MISQTAIIETNHLTRKFGDFNAVNDLDLTVHEGEIFGLLGPNGAGKTTTIRMLCGILIPSSGEGHVLGFDIAREPEQIKKRIGYMSQQFSLYNDLTAVENMRFYAEIYGLPPEAIERRLEELIEMAGLAAIRNQITANLSGAWRQRLALACAIVHKPPMLFLDEPTAGVDPASRKDFWDLIYQMTQEGVTVLATTHYMDEAEYCQSIGMMYQSQLVCQASPQQLKDSLQDPIIEVECDQPNQAVKILAGIEEVKDVTPYGLLLHATVDSAKQAMKKISIELTRNNINISQLEVIQPTLEDVFLNVISKIENQKKGK